MPRAGGAAVSAGRREWEEFLDLFEKALAQRKVITGHAAGSPGVRPRPMSRSASGPITSLGCTTPEQGTAGLQA